MVTVSAPGPPPDPDRRHGWRRALDREELHRYLTTLEGWREFAIRDPAPPDLLPDGALDDLDPDEREDYDDGRIDYHTRLTVAETSTLRTVIHTGRRLTLLNRHAISARRGLILSGPAGDRQDDRAHPVRQDHRGHRPAAGTPESTAGSRSSTSPFRPPRPPACWPWSSPVSWAFPSPAEPTSPMSSRPSAAS